ncbi:MAG: hypothetical protein ACOC2Y_00480 [Spirochaetota bacterium]
MVRLVFAESDPQLSSRLNPLVDSAARRTATLVEAGRAARDLAAAGYADAAAGLARDRAREIVSEPRIAVAAMLVGDRRRWTLQRTLIAPVSRGVFVAGKITGRLLVGIVQYSVAIGSGLVLGAVFGIDFGSSPLVLAMTLAPLGGRSTSKSSRTSCAESPSFRRSTG